MEKSGDESMQEILETQKSDANRLFVKFVDANYLDWLNDPDEDSPLMSPNLMKEKVI